MTQRSGICYHTSQVALWAWTCLFFGLNFFIIILPWACSWAQNRSTFCLKLHPSTPSRELSRFVSFLVTSQFLKHLLLSSSKITEGVRHLEQTLANGCLRCHYHLGKPVSEKAEAGLWGHINSPSPIQTRGPGYPHYKQPLLFVQCKIYIRHGLHLSRGGPSWSPEGEMPPQAACWAVHDPAATHSTGTAIPLTTLPLPFCTAAPPSTEVSHLSITRVTLKKNKTPPNSHTELLPGWQGWRSLSKQHHHIC